MSVTLQAQYPTVTYPTGRAVVYESGVGLRDMTGIVNGLGFTGMSVTARAGGTRAAATPLTSAANLIAICATTADSVSLPPAVGGQVLWLSNGGAASAQVFASPTTSDTINGVAAATGIALAAGKSMTLFSPIPGAWFGVLSA